MLARLPRASMGHAVLLTLPSDGNRPSWSYHHTGTLPRLISFVSHSYANTGGGGYSSHFGTRQSTAVMRTRYIIQVLSFHILAHSFALFCILKELNSLLFNRFRTLHQKTPRGGYPFSTIIPPRISREWGGQSSPVFTSFTSLRPYLVLSLLPYIFASLLPPLQYNRCASSRGKNEL